MKTRIISACILILLLMGLLYLGGIFVFAALLIIDALCLYEYTNLADNDKTKTFLMILLGSGMLILTWFDKSYLFACLPMIFVAIFGYNIINKNYSLENILLNIWAILYIPFFLSLFTTIIKCDNWIYFTVLAIIACYSSDTFAYFTGVKFGKHKLCPAISPKKTVEGFWGGFAGSIICSLITGIIFANCFNFYLPVYHYLLLGMIISAAGLIGDLCASMVKRRFNAKDYGNLIPGHGGMLDRVDSLMFTLAVMYFYMSIILNVI